MTYDYEIEYNGRTSKSYGFEVMQRPNIPAPVQRYTEVEAPGRDGKLHRFDGDIEDIEIEIMFNYLVEPNDWTKKFRKAKKWLLGDVDNRLSFSDDDSYFYKVKRVSIDQCERVDWRIGRFSAFFTCEGYQYVSEGAIEREYTETIYNAYSLSKPIYKITGEGVCYLTVNGSQMAANVGQNLTIDTDLMIAYRTDGEIMNTSVTGEYKDLFLIEGTNTISITKGFGMTITPNWRAI
ncbi:MAG: distal tail protein Dit [Sporomusa sp.]